MVKSALSAEALERQSMLNERIASEIEMMSQEALLYLQEHFEKELDNYFTDDSSEAQIEKKKLQNSADKV